MECPKNAPFDLAQRHVHRHENGQKTGTFQGDSTAMPPALTGLCHPALTPEFSMEFFDHVFQKCFAAGLYFSQAVAAVLYLSILVLTLLALSQAALYLLA